MFTTASRNGRICYDLVVVFSSISFVIIRRQTYNKNEVLSHEFVNDMCTTRILESVV